MRPDRALVVTNRVVTAVSLGHRAHAPPREEPGPEQVFDDVPGPIVADDAAPEQMADVRGERVDGLLVAVEREGIVGAVLEPEVVVERLLEVRCLLLELLRKRLVAPDLSCEACTPAPGVVDVSL